MRFQDTAHFGTDFENLTDGRFSAERNADAAGCRRTLRLSLSDAAGPSRAGRIQCRAPSRFLPIMILQLAATLAAGAAAGLLLARLRVPGGFMIGSLFGSAAFNIAFECAWVPTQFSALVQIVSGAFIGCSMERSDLVRLPHILKPALIMLAALLCLMTGCGFLIHGVSSLDLVTSLMSVVPGGISDTPIVAADMGADGPKVALLQMVRQILGLAVLPNVIYVCSKHFGGDEEPRSAANTAARVKTRNASASGLLLTLLVAGTAGLAGRMLGVPAGTFVFALLASLAFKLGTDRAYLPRPLKKAAQILSGCCLGSTVTMAGVLSLADLILPVCIIVTAYTLNVFITGRIISRFCGFNRSEGMLITTPAGASDMALIAADIGIVNTDVVILQVVRAVTVMAVFPQIVALILLAV